MNKSMLSVIAGFLSLGAVAQAPKYEVSIDLTAVTNDQIPVSIKTPAVSSETIEYQIPKVVPGTYSISDFGRFVTDFAAYDAEGNPLPVAHDDTNRWIISNATELSKIDYKVHDTRDAFDGYTSDSENVIFEPGGTDINAEKDLYVMNTFGFIGYLDGKKSLPYAVSIKHDENIYGASALKKVASGKTTDTFVADDYNFLADGPILYCAPDTVSQQIANAKVMVSVYSPNKVLSAKEVMDNLTELMNAQAKYLGGKLPVDRYAFLIILFDDATMSGSYGALEHSYSSLYFLPEAAGEQISQTVRDVAAHEFFHIVTPLNIHAEQIGDFDYIDPKMSAHLWLYEGVTEYSSIHVQAKYGLYESNEQFVDAIAEKIARAKQYPEGVSFTEMSSKILEPEFEPMYGNVYQKGALIGMCLDLIILKNSNGEKDLQWLMRELSKKYGKSKSFEDDQLFDVITALTYPEVGEFLEKHVAGAEPLPFEEVLNYVGITYTPPQKSKTISLGHINFGVNDENQLIVVNNDSMNEFGEDLKIEEGDILLSLNGEPLTLPTFGQVIGNYKENTKAGDKVVIEVSREVKGKMKTKKLKAKAIEVDSWTEAEVHFNEEATPAQKELLSKWIMVK